jgi:hypothetical protein
METKIEKLDSYVIKTLDVIGSWEYPQVNITKSDKNVFMGSGSAVCVSQMFNYKFGGISLSADQYLAFLQNATEKEYNIYILSASGGKDAVNMAQACKDAGMQASLITCNQDAPCKDLVKEMFVFPSFVDPPTYNVSTYFGMVYWLFKENPREARDFVLKLKKINLRKFKSIFFVSDDLHAPIAKMATRKVGECLENIMANGEGQSQATHGVILQPNKHRLIIRLNTNFPVNNSKFYDINIDSFLGLLASTYYLIGQNQKNSDIKNTINNYSKTVQENHWKLTEKQ